MRTTVHFVTNRQRDPATADPAKAFSALMAPPGPGRLSWGTAFVDGTDPDPARLAKGRITDLSTVSGDAFDRTTEDDIIGSGKNLLIFLHGFANSFDDAITRAAFLREWFAASGEPEADCSVIAFTWPSPGLAVDPKDIVPGIALSLFSLLGFALSHELQNPIGRRYLADRTAARNSGMDVASAFDRLVPLVARARAAGRKVFLLAHSMGHVALQGAVEASLAAGMTPQRLFDEAVLAAADADATQAGRSPPWLTALQGWASRISLYTSKVDQILWLSEGVNGVARLGEDGPPDKANAAAFPPANCRFVNCDQVQPTDPTEEEVDFTHQYYRRVPAVRDDIAQTLAGGGAPGISLLWPNA